MSRLAWYRALVAGGAIALLEALCLAGAIDKITMPPPHLIVRDLYRMLASGRMNGAIGNEAMPHHPSISVFAVISRKAARPHSWQKGPGRRRNTAMITRPRWPWKLTSAAGTQPQRRHWTP